MLRIAGTLAMFFAVAGWLVLSYWPAAASALPSIAFDSSWAAAWLPLVVAAVFVIVAAIQIWIVYATIQPLRKPATAAQAATVRQFHLGVGAETMLTAAPLVMTAVLAAVIVLASN